MKLLPAEGVRARRQCSKCRYFRIFVNRGKVWVFLPLVAPLARCLRWLGPAPLKLVAPTPRTFPLAPAAIAVAPIAARLVVIRASSLCLAPPRRRSRHAGSAEPSALTSLLVVAAPPATRHLCRRRFSPLLARRPPRPFFVARRRHRRCHVVAAAPLSRCPPRPPLSSLEPRTPSHHHNRRHQSVASRTKTKYQHRMFERESTSPQRQSTTASHCPKYLPVSS